MLGRRSVACKIEIRNDLTSQGVCMIFDNGRIQNNFVERIDSGDYWKI